MPCMIALGLSGIVEVDVLTLTVKVGVLRWVFHASEADGIFLIVAWFALLGPFVFVRDGTSWLLVACPLTVEVR